MPIYVQPLPGGSFIGVPRGNCEYYDTRGTVMKGFFVNGKLEGPNNILIEFKDTEFIQYKGVFSGGKQNGVITKWSYSGSQPLTELNTIVVNETICTYENGTLVSESSAQEKTVYISIVYKTIRYIVYMTSFALNAA